MGLSQAVSKITQSMRVDARCCEARYSQGRNVVELVVTLLCLSALACHQDHSCLACLQHGRPAWAHISLCAHLFDEWMQAEGILGRDDMRESSVYRNTASEKHLQSHFDLVSVLCTENGCPLIQVSHAEGLCLLHLSETSKTCSLRFRRPSVALSSSLWKGLGLLKPLR